MEVFPDVQVEARNTFSHFFWSSPDLCGLWYLAEQMQHTEQGAKPIQNSNHHLGHDS